MFHLAAAGRAQPSRAERHRGPRSSGTDQRRPDAPHPASGGARDAGRSRAAPPGPPAASDLALLSAATVATAAASGDAERPGVGPRPPLGAQNLAAHLR